MTPYVEKVFPCGAVIRVDEQDAHLLFGFNWSITRGYAYRSGRRGPRRSVYLHREIAQPPEGMSVDHIDGNPSNNVRSNLRFATVSQNNANRRATRRPGCFRGVFAVPRNAKKPWKAQITVNRASIHLGYFESEAAAAKAYDAAAAKHFGEFARLNCGAA